jgi:Ni2+-binding GTPase involved in maturation of urease and hydrogenase
MRSSAEANCQAPIERGAGLDLLLVERSDESADASPTHRNNAESHTGAFARVSVFSATGGDDKAARYPRRLLDADLVLLTKIELSSELNFNVTGFREDVRSRSAAELLELSVRTGAGIHRWLAWLSARVARHGGAGRSNRAALDRTRGAALRPECFIG